MDEQPQTDEKMIAEIEAIRRKGYSVYLSTEEVSRLLALAKAGMRLPRTADDVPVTPGMRVWVLANPVDDGHVRAVGTMVEVVRSNSIVWRDGSGLYATPEAAAAARAAEQENE